MKKIFILFFSVIPIFSYSQVGINTQTPTNDLDVNGSVRIRSLDDGLNNQYLLSADNDGVVHKIDRSMFSESKSVTLAPGATSTITNDSEYTDMDISISSQNSCSRSMITSFACSRDAVVCLGGIARDKIGTATTETVAASASVYSPKWILNFPSVTNCSGDGGTGTQFDFSFQKTSLYAYQITNLGNVSRTYKIVFTNKRLYL